MHSTNRILVCIAMLFFMFSNAQDKEKKEPKKLSIKVGQSTDSDVTKSQPAKFTATNPRGSAKSSYNIQGFVEIGWSIPNDKDQKINFSILLEQHKNTLIEKEQDVSQVGAQANWKLWYNSGNAGYQPKLTGNIKHSKDRVKEKNEGGQFLAHLSFYPHKDVVDKWYDGFLQNENPIPSNRRELDVDGKQVFFSDFLQFKSTHTIGLEYLEYAGLTLCHFAYNLELYPLSGLLYQAFNQYQLIRVDLGLNHWGDFGKDTDLFTGTSLIGSIGLNVFTNKEKSQSIGIAFAYKEGGNPLKGLVDQTYNELTITANLSLDAISYKD